MSSALQVCLGLWRTPVGAQPSGGRSPVGPAATAGGTPTAAPNNGIAPPTGYGSLPINRRESDLVGKEVHRPCLTLA